MESIFLITLLPSLLPILAQCSPLVQEQQQRMPVDDQRRQQPIWVAIERVLTSSSPFNVEQQQGDVVLVRPDLCDKPCAELLGPGATAIPGANCVCRCPNDEPVFLQQKSYEKCAQKISDCYGRPVWFEMPQNPMPQFVPAISLPSTSEPLGEQMRIAWKESGIKVRQNQGPRCSIKGANFIGNQSEWHPLTNANKLFKLGWSEGNGRVLWIGDNTNDAQLLAGGIVRLELDCAAGRNANNVFCLTMRVEGQVGLLPNSEVEPQNRKSSASNTIGMELEHGRRAEVIVIILLAILLFLTLFGSVFLWNFCWRMHKQKLIHSLQLQFLNYARQEKEKAISECQLRYQALVKAAAGIRNNSSNFDVGQCSNNSGNFANLNETPQLSVGMEMLNGQEQAEQEHNEKNSRRLYFSSEFFEPQQMSNPPPMAEKFLFDLRNMIGVARDRIRTRRHVPRLPPVVESEDESVSGVSTSNVVALTETVDVTQSSVSNEKKVSKESERSVNANENEISRAAEMETTKFECEEEDKELALSMEQIMREQQQKQTLQKSDSNNIANDLAVENEETSSPRSSLDSGRGSERHEDGMDVDEDRRKEENKDEAGNSEKPIETTNEEVKEKENLMDTDDQPTSKEKPDLYGNKTMALNINNKQQQHIVRTLEMVTGQSKQQQKSLEQQRQTAADVSQSQLQSVPSRIPVGTVSTSKSPRMHLKFAALTHRPPPLPPRPPPPPPCSSGEFSDGKSNGVNEPQKSLLLTAARRRAREHLDQRQQTNNNNKGSTPLSTYAVCPPPSYASDRMKKSLPRRKKVVAINAAAVSTSTSTAVV